jgi:hypothetical protein
MIEPHVHVAYAHRTYTSPGADLRVVGFLSKRWPLDYAPDGSARPVEASGGRYNRGSEGTEP